MRTRVEPDGVVGFADRPDEIGLPRRRLPHHEEGRARVVTFQKLCDTRREIGMRSIVEGQGSNWFMSDDICDTADDTFDCTLDRPIQSVAESRCERGLAH